MLPTLMPVTSNIKAYNMTQNEIKMLILERLNLDDLGIDLTNTTDRVVRRLNTEYSLLYNAALQHFPWSFANAYAQLTRNDDATSPRFKYRYDMPADYKMIRGAYSDTNKRMPVHNRSIIGDKIYTNEPTLFAWYVRDVPEEQLPEYYINWFAYRVAIPLCVPLTGDDQQQGYLEAKEPIEFRIAKSADRVNAEPITLPTNTFLF